jgi:hypothetical protein
MTERDTQLANLARELHLTRKFSPMQIRQRAGFLDSNDQPYIPLETIQSLLDGAPAAAPTPSQPAPALPLQADDTSALHAKMARMEAQLRRLSSEARKTTSPGCSPRVSRVRSESSRLTSPRATDSREVIIELKQMNAQLVAQLTTAIAALGVVDRCDPAPPIRLAAAKPSADGFPRPCLPTTVRASFPPPHAPVAPVLAQPPSLPYPRHCPPPHARPPSTSAPSSRQHPFAGADGNAATGAAPDDSAAGSRAAEGKAAEGPSA